MARIRTIKPEFWTDGNVVKLSPLARLFFIGMWNFTLCDHGHVADDAFRLKLQILPTDDVDPDDLLGEIMAAGRVQRILDGDGRAYLHIKRFSDHQKIDPRWKTRCPACAQVDSLVPIETPVSLSEPQRDSAELALGRDGMGRDGKKTSSKPPASKEFDSFWASYPRKIGKDLARKAFEKALKRADPRTIMDGLETLRKEVAGKDQQFIPHPSSWLNAGRWQDEAPQGALLAVVPQQYGWANQ
ncbi:hypothetical protein [Arthrobacter sp. efr-133-TYG-120]|uniref:hypothetical protein n=1 Tax=Arthrobacter sp. efr-133-TYG-120 TaxID=3040280 RepID=UPI00254C00D8|nr:hypothetical protein [Arthrobacter sp. efr-133-TYG-120]